MYIYILIKYLFIIYLFINILSILSILFCFIIFFIYICILINIFFKKKILLLLLLLLLISPGGMKDDIVYIGNALSADEAKLAFSTGFSRSVKLSVLEDLLDQYLYKNKWIPDYLSRGKRLPLSRTQVLQRIGELFQLRGSANLYTDLLDTPDFCWSSDQLAEYFGNISRVLEIRSRMSIFNRKLDYANDMSSLMKSHLKERHNFKLEWIIITLIAIEVFAGGVTVLEKLGYINFDRFHKHYTDVKIENVDNDSELLKDEKKYIEDTK